MPSQPKPGTVHSFAEYVARIFISMLYKWWKKWDSPPCSLANCCRPPDVDRGQLSDAFVGWIGDLGSGTAALGRGRVGARYGKRCSVVLAEQRREFEDARPSRRRVSYGPYRGTQGVNGTASPIRTIKMTHISYCNSASWDSVLIGTH
jgi:hypothetical protein